MELMAPAGIGRELEGIHAVAAALEAGRVEKVFVERRRLSELEQVLDLVGVEVEVVDRLSGTTTMAPQGIAARCRPLPIWDLAQLAGRIEPAALIVLDRVADPHNIGAVARSAAAAGAGGMVIASKRAGPIGATAFKAAAGALERLPVAIVNSVADAVERLKQLDVWTVGLDAGASQSLFGLELLGQPVAIVVGAEGEGLSRLVAERVDLHAAIPMAAESESLNASVAAALAMFEVARVRSGG